MSVTTKTSTVKQSKTIRDFFGTQTISIIGTLLAFIIAFYAVGGVRPIGVWIGAVAVGMAMALVAVGVYITFHILEFPDLIVSYPDLKVQGFLS